MLNQTQKKPDIIVGMGPGGLMAAIELANSGQPVIILEKRPIHSRSIRVEVDPIFLNDIKSVQSYITHKSKEDIEKDADFFKSISNNVVISDLEDYLERQLKYFPNLITVKKGPQYILDKTNFDLENHTITLDNQTIPYQHIIAADGSHRTTAHLIKDISTEKNIPIEADIKFLDFAHKLRQQEHSTICFATSQRAGMNHTDKEFTLNDLTGLSKAKWVKNTCLIAIYFLTPKKHIFI